MDLIKDKIESSFEELGVVYDRAVIDKCVSLYVENGFENADELVDSWMAFSVTHLQGDDPKPQHLAKFEREFLAKKTKQSTHADIGLKCDLDDDIMQAYGSHTPQRKVMTPDAPRRNLGRFITSPKNCFSPASYSPITGTPPAKYTSRKNPGSILCEQAAASDSQLSQDKVNVRVLGKCLESVKFMSFHLTDVADSAQLQMANILSQLSSKFSLSEMVPVTTKDPTSVIVGGRIACDADGKLNAESVMLEGSPVDGGQVVRLDLSSLPDYSIFPGQVVALEGLNNSGRKFVANKLWSDAAPSEPPPSVDLPGGLKVMVACGPFTTTDSLCYQPLIDFLEIVGKEEPHLLLLIGPLVDSDNPLIASGDLAESFTDTFNRLISQILAAVAGLKTEVVFVSSHRESHGCVVFPTPPVMCEVPHAKFTIAPDPCFIEVEGFVIAATSVDVLMHLGREELSFPPHSGERLSRLAAHVLQQQSFYPLRPPVAGIPLDPSLEQYLSISTLPHLLILPSDLKCFIKNLGCCVVNPERLAKGLVGGSFASLIIDRKGCVSGQIIKI